MVRARSTATCGETEEEHRLGAQGERLTALGACGACGLVCLFVEAAGRAAVASISPRFIVELASTASGTAFS